MTRRAFLALVPGLGTIVPESGTGVQDAPPFICRDGILLPASSSQGRDSQTLRTLRRDDDAVVTEFPKAEGFIVRGPLLSASPDGERGYYAIGTTTLLLPPDSALVPSTEALVGARVKLELIRT